MRGRGISLSNDDLIIKRRNEKKKFPGQFAEHGTYTIYIHCTRDVKDCTISRLSSMAMNMLFMMVRHAQKVKGEA